MKQSVFLLVLLSSMFCEAQSVLTTPAESTRSVPGSASPPTTGADSMSVRDPQQMREKPTAMEAVILFRPSQRGFRLRTGLLGR